MLLQEELERLSNPLRNLPVVRGISESVTWKTFPWIEGVCFGLVLYLLKEYITALGYRIGVWSSSDLGSFAVGNPFVIALIVCSFALYAGKDAIHDALRRIPVAIALQAASSLMLCIGCVLSIGMPTSNEAEFIGQILLGVSVPMVFAGWGAVLAAIDMYRSIVACVAASVVSVVLPHIFALDFLGLALCAVLACVISTTGWTMCARHLPHDREELAIPDRRKDLRAFWMKRNIVVNGDFSSLVDSELGWKRQAACIAAFMAIVGLMGGLLVARGMRTDWSPVSAGVESMAILLWFGIIVFSAVPSFKRVSIPLFLGIVGMISFMAFLPGSAGYFFAQVLLIFVTEYFWIFMIYSDVLTYRKNPTGIPLLGVSAAMPAVTVLFTYGGLYASSFNSEEAVLTMLVFISVMLIVLLVILLKETNLSDATGYDIAVEGIADLDTMKPLRNAWGEAQFYLRAVSPETSATINDEVADLCNLSNREREVFDLLVKGHTVSLISEELHISLNTVKTHTRHIYQKAEVGSRMELIKKCEDYAVFKMGSTDGGSSLGR